MRLVIKIVGVGLLVVGAGVVGVGIGRLDEKVVSMDEVRIGEVVDLSEVKVLEAPDPCVVAFADGGGPYYQENAPMREDIAPGVGSGERLAVRGRLWNEDCTKPLAGLVVDVWQASAEGEYDQEWYRGRVVSGEDGSFEFVTVIPKGYGEGTAYRPPHIHFKVWDGERLLVTSQMFFPDVRGRVGFDEVYIMELEKQVVEGVEMWVGWHDVVVG